MAIPGLIANIAISMAADELRKKKVDTHNLPVIGGGIIDRRNEDFSSSRESVANFNETMLGQAVLSGPPESLSYLQRLNPFNTDRDSPLYQGDMEDRARAISNAKNEAAWEEGNVWVNDKLIPGIFQGFKVGGGINIVKFAQAKLREKFDPKSTIPADAQLFQLDAGIKPFRGNASFIFLNDYFSSAIEKAREFMRIITEDNYIKRGADKLHRVWKINGFLINEGGPFVAETFKIVDYSIEMPPGMSGRMMGQFEFEQFQITTGEMMLKTPITNDISDSGREIKMEQLNNPMEAEPSPV